MKRNLQKTILKICCALLLVLSINSWSQATLPFSYDGGKPSGTAGLTHSGLGGDYSTSPKMKFDSSSDEVILNFATTPGELGYIIKWNPSSGTSFPGTFEVMESADGNNYTTLKAYGSQNGQINLTSAGKTESAITLNSSTRYVKWVYTNKTNGNIALGAITLSAGAAGNTAPFVTNQSSTPLTTSAILSGNVTNTGGAPITATGNVYSLTSTNSSPIIGGSGVTNIVTPSPGAGTGGYFNNTGNVLEVNTQYTYNSYATNSIGTSYGTAATFYTLANDPSITSVNNATFNSLDVAFDGNVNPSYTQFAIMANGFFVQSDYTLGSTPFWQTASQWPATVTVTGLSSETEYSFSVAARNGDQIETDFSSPVTGITLQFIQPNVIPTELADFGNVCIGSSVTNNFTFDGENLNGSDIMISGDSAYTYSTSEEGSYSNPLSISYSGSSITNQIVFVRFSPTAVTNYNGPVNFSGGGLSEGFQVSAIGSGVNTPVSITDGTTTDVSGGSAHVLATISAACSAISSYGVEYSTTDNFTAGSGTMVEGTDLSGNDFTVTLSGLLPNTVYYYMTYAIDASGTTNGAQQSFTTENLDAPVATAATDVLSDSFTANWNGVSGATGYQLSVMTSLASVSEDFSDANFTAAPVWSGSTSNYSVVSDSSFPSGSGTTDGFFLASNASVGASALVTASTEVNEWKFNLGNGAFGPATTNYFGVILMSNNVVSAVNNSFNGYYIKLGANNADDHIELYRKSGSSSILIGEFGGAYPSGFQSGIALRITRSNTGVFELFYSDNTFAEPSSYTSGGTLTDATYSASAYFGVFTSFANTNVARRVYIDNIVLGTPVFVPGYENLAVSGTSQSVSGLDPSTTYYYQVQAVSATSTSAGSNVVSAMTTAAVPTVTFGELTITTPVSCENSEATFNVSGLPLNSDLTFTFNIAGGADQTAAVTSDGSGMATFYVAVTMTENNQILTITEVHMTADAAQTLTVTENNEATIMVNPNVVYYADADGDGFGDSTVTTTSCTGLPEGYVVNDTDCDDTNENTWQTGMFFTDNDGDGYTIGDQVSLCYGAETPTGYATSTLGEDCNDEDSNAYQSADLYIDNDNDGFDNGISAAVCYGEAVPTGLSSTTNGADCDDNDENAFQHATLFADQDNDGYTVGDAADVCYGATIPTGYSTTSAGEDCNDNDENAFQSATLYIDMDNDGYDAGTEAICYGASIPEGYSETTSGSDCDDTDSETYHTVTLYQDTDNDGYDGGSMDVCSGSSIPEGYSESTLGTDCDDSDAAINPGATEITGNGIDENCNGMDDDTPIGEFVTQLRASQCGSTLPRIYTAMIANNSFANTTGWRWEITNMSTMMVQMATTSVPALQLTDLAQYEYGTTYSVRIELQINGEYVGYYGPSCTVTTPSLASGPVAIVIPQCGTTLPQRFSPIFITGPNFISSYEIRVTNQSTMASAIISTSVPYFTIKMFPALYDYSTSYSIEVRVRTVAGTSYSEWTNACTVTTPGAPAARTAATSATFKAVAYPNPYNDTFAVNMQTTNQATVQVKVYDMVGKLLEVRDVAPTAIEGQRLGNQFPSGVYNVVITQGEISESIRVIKR